MKKKRDKFIILVTAPNKKEARRIARHLISQRLAACVNILPGVDSLFWWQGKIDKAKENILIIKSKKSLISKLISEIKKIHSYKVPEIIALEINAGLSDYLDWIESETR